MADNDSLPKPKMLKWKREMGFLQLVEKGPIRTQLSMSEPHTSKVMSELHYRAAVEIHGDYTDDDLAVAVEQAKDELIVQLKRVVKEYEDGA